MRALQGQDVDKLLVLAREFLIRARIAAQQAVILKETPDNAHSDAEVTRVITSYRQDAYAARKEAREILRKIDLWNSKRFMRGQTFLGLCHTLNGRNFRNWQEYQEQYEIEILFQGVDPY